MLSVAFGKHMALDISLHHLSHMAAVDGELMA
jgi:hypothetical protein